MGSRREQLPDPASHEDVRGALVRLRDKHKLLKPDEVERLARLLGVEVDE